MAYALDVSNPSLLGLLVWFGGMAMAISTARRQFALSGAQLVLLGVVGYPLLSLAVFLLAIFVVVVPLGRFMNGAAPIWVLKLVIVWAAATLVATVGGRMLGAQRLRPTVPESSQDLP